MHNNLLLYLPFNESQGSAKAYDFSPSNKHATLEDVTYTKGYVLNGVYLDEGLIESSLEDLASSEEMTILFWLKPAGDIGTLTCNVINLDNYQHSVFASDLIPDKWHSIALVKNNTTILLYINGKVVDTVEWSGELWDIDILTEHNIEPIGVMDNLKIYNKALNSFEIDQEAIPAGKLQYFINGLEFIENFGVYVSASSGIIDALQRKETIKHDWKDYHGEVIDLAVPRYESRLIELECFIKADGKIDTIDKFQRFIAQFDQPGTQRLKINIDDTKPLVYEVYRSSLTALQKQWRDEEMISTFSIELREPDPVKTVYRHIRTGEENKTASFTITSPTPLSIFWGDGTKTPNVRGTGQVVSHDYANNGNYDIVIAGNIEEIESITTNEILLWNKL